MYVLKIMLVKSKRLISAATGPILISCHNLSHPYTWCDFVDDWWCFLTNNCNITWTTAKYVSIIDCFLCCFFSVLSRVWWTKDGEVISMSNDSYEGGTISYPPLIIKSFTSYDTGDYNCYAKNELGTGSFTSSTTLIMAYLECMYYLDVFFCHETGSFHRKWLNFTLT